MKEFENIVKSAVRFTAPNREAIRNAVKEERFLVKTAPVKEESAVGSIFRTVGTAAALFLVVIGIFVASVLVEQTRRPTGAGAGTTESTDSYLDDVVIDQTIYPLNYMTADGLPLWEGRTSDEEIAERLNNGTIIFADTTVSVKSDWIASDLENLTTTRLHQISGCELIADKQHFYLLEDNKLYTVSEIPDAIEAYITGEEEGYFGDNIPSYYLYVNVVPCQFGDNVGFILSYYSLSAISYDLYSKGEVYHFFNHDILYFDCLTKSSMLLLTSSFDSSMDDMDYYFAGKITEEDNYLFGGHLLAIQLQSLKDGVAHFRIATPKGNTYGENSYEIGCILLYNESYEYRCDLYYDMTGNTWTYEKQKQPPVTEAPPVTQEPEVTETANAQTEAPVTEEPPVTQEPEVTIPAWGDEHLTDIYPLNYYTEYDRPLWEERTSEEDLAEKLNNGDITFAPQNELLKKEGLWEADDIENVTTKELYKTCGVEMVLMGSRVFLLEEHVLYSVDDNALANGGILSFCYVPVQMGSSHGVIVSISRYNPRMDYNSIDADTISYVITYFDMETHIEKRLFTENVSLSELPGITGEAGKMFPHVNFHGIGDQVLFSIPGDGYLALHKVSESEDKSHYQLISFFDVKKEYRDVFDRETNQISAIHYVTDIGAYYLVGDLYYNAEEAVWSFVLNDEPAPDIPSTTQ